MRVRNVPLAVALKYICDQTKTLYVVDEKGVTILMANDPWGISKTASPDAPQVTPPLPKNPAPTSNTKVSGPFVWKSKDGKSVQAEFVGLDGEAVVIKRNGKEFTIPFTRLDAHSVAQAKALAAKTTR